MKELNTFVDTIFNLIKEKKKISFREISKKVKLSEKEVEKIVNILEEDGSVRIEYTLSSPFAIFVEKKKTDDIDFIRESLKEIKQLIKQNNVLEAKRSLLSLLAFIKSNKTKLSIVSDKLIDFIENKLINLLKKSKFQKEEEFKEELVVSIDEITAGIDSSDVDDELDEKKSVSIDKERDINKENSLTRFKDTSNLELLYNQLNQALQKKDFKLAESIFKQLIDKENKLLSEYLKEKKDLDYHIGDFYIKFNNEIKKYYEEKYNELKTKIKELFDYIKNKIKKKEFNNLDNIFNQAKELINKLPDINIIEKRKLHLELNDLFYVYQKTKLIFYQNEFNKKYSEFFKTYEVLIKDIKILTLKKAIDLYKNMIKIYTTLPKEGFFEKRAEMYEILLNLSKFIIQNYKTKKLTTVKSIADLINYELINVRKAFNNLDIKSIAYHYKNILYLYNLIPQDNFEVKHFYFKKIKDIKEKITLLDHILTKRRLDPVVNKINSLIELALNNIKNNKIEDSLKQYKEILKNYYSIQERIDLLTKNYILNKIGKLYEEILLKKDLGTTQKELNLKKNEDNDLKLYRELIETISYFFIAIQNNQFDKILKIYDHIRFIYNRIPIFIIKEHKEIINELNEIILILKIYIYSLMILNEIKNKNKIKLMILLKNVYKIYNELNKINPLKIQNLLILVNKIYNQAYNFINNH